MTPGGVTMAPTEVRQFFATAVYSDGFEQDITAIAEWTTSDSRNAKVSQLHGSRGEVTARDPGTVEIRAALEFGGSKTKGFVTLTVFAGALVAIETQPSSKNLDVGIPEEFKAKGRYANGYVGNLRNEDVTWASSNPAVATVAIVDDVVTVTPLQTTGGNPVIIRATHTASGLQNSDEDGATNIKAQITHIQFDLDDNAMTIGAGMIATADVYAQRIDGSRSKITKDVEFEITGPPGVITITEGGDSAGDVSGLSDGTVTVTATDPHRVLTTAQPITVVVSGVLVAVEIEPDPFKVSVGDERTSKVFGRLSSGLSTPDLRRLVTWQIDDPSIATVGILSENYGKITGVSLGETLVRATELSTGMVSAPATVVVGGAITDVSVEPTEVVLGETMILPLDAYGNRSDGSRSNVTRSVEWQIEPAGIATVHSPSGTIFTLSSGTAAIRAVLNAGTPEQLISPDITLRVEGTLVGLRVTPTNFKVVRDERRKAGVEGDLSTGGVTSDLRTAVQWSIADATVAAVGSGNPDPDEVDPLDPGEVLGLKTGVTTLTATEPISGLSSTETDNLRVQGDVVSVEVDEGNGGVVPVSEPILYKARATYTDESTSVISDRCEWSIDDESIAKVDDILPKKGLVTGFIIGGRTTIRIDCDGLIASGIVEVAGDVLSLDIDPHSFKGKALGSRRFRAAADYEGGVRGDATEFVTWSSTNPVVATVDNGANKGLVKFLSDGDTLISAVHDQSGHVAIASVTVTGGVSQVRVIPDSKTLGGSTGRNLKVIASFSAGGDELVTSSVTWTSSDEEIARMSDREGEENRVLAGTKLGTATITATLPGGETGTSTITVDTLLESITVAPDRRTIEVGRHRRVSARAHFENGSRRAMSRYVEFISDAPAVAAVVSFGSQRGRVIGIAPGFAAIRARDPITGIVSSDSVLIEVTAP